MARTYLVLDQNMFRSPELQALVDSDRNSHFIVIDEALLEMCKSAQWESTLRRSLAILSRFPARVRMTMSTADALRWEMANKKSISGRFVDKEATNFLREILVGLRDGEDSAGLERMRAGMMQTHVELGADQLNHSANKNQLVALVDVTRSIGDESFLKSLRNNSLPRHEKLKAIRDLSPKLIDHFFTEAGFVENEVKSFVSQHPLVLRRTYIRLWRCWDWLAKGGLESLPDEKVTNENFDQDYVAIATFFGGIVSKEHKVNETYEDIAWIVRNRN